MKTAFRLEMSIDDKLINEFEKKKKKKQSNFHRSENMRRNKSRNALTVSRFSQEKNEIESILKYLCIKYPKRKLRLQVHESDFLP